jgi:NOL1/NOP2/fmu family ribosome biogenesis protein
MFRKDEEAQRQWSEDNVALCEARQRRITADVWPSLRQGGVFVYSTCTFNKYENDDNVQWIASELGAECLLEDDFLRAGNGAIKTTCGYSLVPGHVEGEGQYCSALKKISDSEFHEIRHKTLRPSRTQTLPEGVMAGLLTMKAVSRLRGDTVIAIPENISADVALLEQVLHVIAAGCAVGTLKGKVLVPDADLALSLMFDRTAFPEAEVDRDTALAYLHRDAIILPDAPKGYVTIVYEGLPLGFVKNLGNRCNSLHPQGRRIRMNIK